MFSVFENARSLKTTEALQLQIYRSLCREVVRIEHQLAWFELVQENYIARRDIRLKQIVEERLGAQWLANTNATAEAVRFIDDPHLMQMRTGIHELQQMRQEIQECHLYEIEEALNGTLRYDLKPVVINWNVKIPLALSGIGPLTALNSEGVRRKAVFVLGVIPESSGSTLFIHGKSSDMDLMHSYLQILAKDFGLLNMIEQWMVRGTDHWFLSKSIWDPKSSKAKDAIYKEMLDPFKGIAHDASVSIFDNFRRQMIQEHESKGTDKSDSDELLREKAKLIEGSA